MKAKLISMMAAIICIALCLAPLASCDDDGGASDGTTAKTGVTTVPDTSAPDTDVPGTSEPTTESPETSAPETSAPDTDTKPVIDKTAWENMLSDKSFENYTLTLEGRMTAVQDGVEQGTSDVRETVKITVGKVEITVYAEDVDSPANDSFTIVVEGEAAEAQKEQISQIFLAVLSHYESFVYDPLTGNYTVPETLTVETVLKGVSYTPEGELTTFSIPATLVIREAVAAVSADGKLLTFVCDYTQAMNMGGSVISTSGKTTWSFSDYGTTVIE